MDTEALFYSGLRVDRTSYARMSTNCEYLWHSPEDIFLEMLKIPRPEFKTTELRLQPHLPGAIETNAIANIV